tara:strand:+ start:98 stop:844 length:747 start_codon:yes stop_codon:yes gene_type:complete
VLNLIRKISFLLTLVSCSSASAQEADKYSIGAAYIFGENVYEGVGSTALLAPSLSYEDGPLKIDLPGGISYQIYGANNIKFSTSLKPNFAPYDPNDAYILNGMKRHASLDLNLSSSFDIARGSTIKFIFGSELSNQHNGDIIKISYQQFIPVAGFPVILSAGSRWQDSERSRYFYGVYNSEERSDRPEYITGDSNIYFVSLNSFYNIMGSLRLFGNLSVELLPSELIDSPIVGKRTLFNTVWGVGYSF